MNEVFWGKGEVVFLGEEEKEDVRGSGDVREPSGETREV